MKASQILSLFLASTAAAAPAVELESRAINDLDILNFALTLEHLENAFYKEALSKFDRKTFNKAGFSPRLRANIMQVSSDESTHVTFLTSAIKSIDATPVKPCKYAFGIKDVETFMALAQVLEGVGVTAYLGAAALISNKAYLTPAGSILTVEARHNAYIRDSQLDPQSPFPAPFDVPLTPNQVYSLASQFIVSCPKSNPKLPLTAYPTLAQAGSKLSHKLGGSVLLNVGKKLNANKTYHAAWILVTGPVFAKAEVLKGGKQVKIDIPNNPLLAGQSYAVLTTSNSAVTDANTAAGPAIVNLE